MSQIKKEISHAQSDTKVFGYITGKFVPYKNPATQQTVDELESLRKDKNVLILKASSIEKQYTGSDTNLTEFKNWLYEKSNKGQLLMIVEGSYTNPKLKELEASLLDFNAQLYREVLKNFQPKMGYSGTLHNDPGKSVFLVFDSPSMDDVIDDEGIQMIRVSMDDHAQVDFSSAAKKILELLQQPSQYKKICRENFTVASCLTMDISGSMYLYLIASVVGKNALDKVPALDLKNSAVGSKTIDASAENNISQSI